MKDREELQDAYNVLVAHNLWRRGAIDGVDPNTPQEIGEAIDVAAGVLWEIINIGMPNGKEELNASLAHGDWLKKELEVAESANEYLKKELKKAEAERDQAKKELADLWKQCRDTLAEDDEHVDPSL